MVPVKVSVVDIKTFDLVYSIPGHVLCGGVACVGGEGLNWQIDFI